jgi:hypothetical protein
MRKRGQITNAIVDSMRQATHALVHSIDGDRVNLQFGDMPTLIRNVEVIGTASLLHPGEKVDIIWRDGRPVVLAYRTLEASAKTFEVAAVKSDPNSMIPRTVAFFGHEMMGASHTRAAESGMLYTLNVRSPNTNGISWYKDFLLQAGTYRIRHLACRAVTRGRTQMYLDDVYLGIFDWYAASTTWNVYWTQNNIVVPYSGEHRLRLTTHGKNASASEYTMQVTRIALVRTD